MSNGTINPDPTVRGGVPTIIPNISRPGTPRHQPDTPVNKKFPPTKPPPKKRRTKAKEDPPPTPEKPEGENHNGTVTPSQTNGS